MTERLRDLRGSSDPAVAEAARAVSWVPPLAPSPARMAWVRRALDEQATVGRMEQMAPMEKSRRAGRSGRRRGTWILPAAATLGIAATAAAAVGVAHHYYVAARTAPTPAVASTVTAHAQRARTQPSIALPPAQVPPAVTPPAQPQLSRPSNHASNPRTDEETSQATILLGAMRALRQEHEAARAGALLDGYLARYPDGTFIEEALAVDIEAKSALDDPRAAELAGEYLARFPNGHFVAAARAAKERFER